MLYAKNVIQTAGGFEMFGALGDDLRRWLVAFESRARTAIKEELSVMDPTKMRSADATTTLKNLRTLDTIYSDLMTLHTLAGRANVAPGKRGSVKNATAAEFLNDVGVDWKEFEELRGISMHTKNIINIFGISSSPSTNDIGTPIANCTVCATPTTLCSRKTGHPFCGHTCRLAWVAANQ